MSKLWSIPLVSVYLYIATVLTTVGYFDYYGIPSYFVGASVQANITYFFTLFNLSVALMSALGWWVCVGIVIAVFVALYFMPRKLRKAFYVVTVSLFLWLLMHTNVLGGWIAENNAIYLVPSDNCSSFEGGVLYLGIGVSDGKEIFIQADPITHEQLAGFVVKDLAQTSCSFENKYLWTLKK